MARVASCCELIEEIPLTPPSNSLWFWSNMPILFPHCHPIMTLSNRDIISSFIITQYFSVRSSVNLCVKLNEKSKLSNLNYNNFSIFLKYFYNIWWKCVELYQQRMLKVSSQKYPARSCLLFSLPEVILSIVPAKRLQTVLMHKKTTNAGQQTQFELRMISKLILVRTNDDR